MSYNFKYKMIGTTTSGRGKREYSGDTFKEIYEQLLEEQKITEYAVEIYWIEKNLDPITIDLLDITTDGINNLELFEKYEEYIRDNINDTDYYKVLSLDKSHYYFKIFE